MENPDLKKRNSNDCCDIEESFKDASDNSDCNRFETELKKFRNSDEMQSFNFSNVGTKIRFIGDECSPESIDRELLRESVNKTQNIVNNSFTNNDSRTDTKYTTDLKTTICSSKYKLSLTKLSKLEDFEMGQKLGEGRFGEVFLAKHKETGFLVAIKKISKMKIKMNRAESMIVNEILIHKSLHHPNIIKLYTHFHDNEFIYYVLEVASEGSLFEIMKKKKDRRLAEKTVALLIKQLIQALEYMHGDFIIHRDLKPENILIHLVKFF